MKKLFCVLGLFVLMASSIFIHNEEVLASDLIEGAALKDPTHVYAQRSTGGEVLKSYAKGSVLKFRSLSNGWYETSVYKDGVKINAYASANDIQRTDANESNKVIISQYALKDPTHVYSSTSQNSTVLKSYSKGSILKFTEHSADWYAASVYLDGRKVSGYISKMDVSSSYDSGAEVLRGIGLANATPVYSNLSSESRVLKSYPQGSLLAFRKLTDNWYETTVTVRGTRHTGYIQWSDIELESADSALLRGVSLPKTLNVYSLASTNSAPLKSYGQGSSLLYRTFSENWYSAVVYVNGKERNGYIHKSDVENAIENPRDLKGIGLKSPTAVYSNASTDSAPLKTYSQGTVLQYKTFTSQWYEASVYVNGKKRTGYIHTSHTEALNTENQSLTGVALKTPTNVYALASKNARVLKSYSKPNQLRLETFSANWFSATVYVDGKPMKGYVHIDDISTDQIITTVTPYSTDFNRVLDIQMTRAPQVSGKSGGWVNASRQQVSYYVNSSNFDRNSASYFQFLVLSQPAGLSAAEVNQKILYNHGTLTGEAAAFIAAGKKYSINEAYLISHALLETGNGSSTLAKGVPVDNKGNKVNANAATHVVYNMYGIGAVDSCPIECGARTAFEKGWFTPEEAIIGGAEFVNTYVNRGQDTLYKMRWAPSTPGHPQYATDVGWAAKQTTKFEQIYGLLDNFVLIFDVPKYANQPSSSGDPNAYPENEKPPLPADLFPAGVFGKNTDNLNLRNKPTTSGSEVLVTIPKGTKIEIFETNGSWYRTSYKNKSGWVSAEFVTLMNLLEAKVDNLNVRSSASTSGSILGKAQKGELLQAVLRSNGSTIRHNEWYKVTYQGELAWVSGGKNGTEYIKVR